MYCIFKNIKIVKSQEYPKYLLHILGININIIPMKKQTEKDIAIKLI